MLALEPTDILVQEIDYISCKHFLNMCRYRAYLTFPFPFSAAILSSTVANLRF